MSRNQPNPISTGATALRLKNSRRPLNNARDRAARKRSQKSKLLTDNRRPISRRPRRQEFRARVPPSHLSCSLGSGERLCGVPTEQGRRRGFQLQRSVMLLGYSKPTSSRWSEIFHSLDQER